MRSGPRSTYRTKLALAIEFRGRSVRGLAAEVGIPFTSMSRYATGVTIPDKAMAACIAAALDFEPETLFEGGGRA